MIIRQLFDYETYTYTYLIADEKNKLAALIDPVKEKTPQYLSLLQELGLKLALAADTHVHADHITALGCLREQAGAMTYVGTPGEVECTDQHLYDGQTLYIGDIAMKVIYTPGHTNDSFSFYIKDNEQHHIFTGDTLFIRGTGRTDFQNGNAQDLYDSLHNKLLSLPDDTIVYPGHDYRGNTLSTIGEEKAHNPRLQISDKEGFVEFMNNLDLPDPKYMDIAVPANLGCGKTGAPEQ